MSHTILNFYRQQKQLLALMLLLVLAGCVLSNCVQHLANSATAPLTQSVQADTEPTVHSASCEASTWCKMLEALSVLAPVLALVAFALRTVCAPRSRARLVLYQYWRRLAPLQPAHFNYPRLHLAKCVQLN